MCHLSISGINNAVFFDPFIEETISLFKNEDKATKNKVIFIHFNHTNPALQENSAARKKIEMLGFRFASEGNNYEI